MNKSIFVACDVSSHEEILELLSKIHEEISGIKKVYNISQITHHKKLENLVNLINLFFMMVNSLILKIH